MFTFYLNDVSTTLPDLPVMFAMFLCETVMPVPNVYWHISYGKAPKM